MESALVMVCCTFKGGEGPLQGWLADVLVLEAAHYEGVRHTVLSLVAAWAKIFKRVKFSKA